MVKQIIHVPLLSLTVHELKKVNLTSLNLDFIVYETYIPLLWKEMATYSSTFAWKIPWTEKQMCRLILGLHVLFLADINEEKNLPRDF